MSTIDTSPQSATSIPADARRLTIVGAPSVAQRKPEWMKRHIPLAGPNYRELKKTMRGASLHTVCEEAACPNIHQCWEQREASFLIGGEDCTRRCGFCQIATGKPKGYDRDEPRRVAETVAEMGLHFAVVTGVARDDLPDGGAWLYAETARQIHEQVPGCGVELLIPDFRGDEDALREVISARPEVLAHNLETVRRLQGVVRRGATYERSLGLLAASRALAPSIPTKSGLMLGLGETRDEVIATLQDLRSVQCQRITLGQYLRPSLAHIPVDRYWTPEEFDALADVARELGFAQVRSGPLVRSSYHAAD